MWAERWAGLQEVWWVGENRAAKNMTQRDYMRGLYREHGGREGIIMEAYAEAERQGLVDRGSNDHHLDPEQYSRALFSDGMRKGWIREKVTGR